MKNRLTIATGIALILISSGLPTDVTAQNQSDRFALRAWMNAQQNVLSRFAQYETEARILHRIETGNGSKNASIILLYSGDTNDFRGGPRDATDSDQQTDRPANSDGQRPDRLGPPNGRRPEVLEFVLDGDTLDTREGRRVQQGMSALISPEIGPLFFGIHLPFLQYQQLSIGARPTVEVIDGERLLRIQFEPHFPPRLSPRSRGENNRPGGDLANQRPPNGGPPGNRPSLGRPQGLGRPSPGASGRPGVNSGRFEQPAIERTVVWFTEDMTRLVMSATELDLPGDRRLYIRTTYSRIEGLDVPTMQTVKGKFAIQRRLRTTTVTVDNQTYYSAYRFSRKAGTK